ncbi:MAG: DUF58 domain-containing protein [Fimbriimonadaceae bacterium]|nr:DUF58 domain-containing protein [Fimbriimonadaceae bacterium]
MIVPTKRFWALVALGIPMALVGAVVPGFEKFVLPYDVGIFGLLLITGLVAKKGDPLVVKRESDPILSVRVPNAVKLSLENTSQAPVVAEVRDEPPGSAEASQTDFKMTLSPDRPEEVSYTIVPRERGEQDFAGTHVRYLAPLGLAWVQKVLPTQETVRVYPNVKAVKEFDLLKQRGKLNMLGLRRTRHKGLGQEFESLRDYNEDDYRTIDWKASARRGKLVVKNFETEKNQAVIVCVDLGRHMMAEVDGVRKLDLALDSALMLMHTAERKGDQIGLLAFNDVIKAYAAPRKGRAQVAAILDRVHDAQAEPVQPNYAAAFTYLANRWKKRSLLVVFTDAENEDQAQDLVSSLGPIHRRHLLMVVRVADPKLRELRALRVQDDRDMYARTAALWYAADRKKAESVLRAAGFHTLEAEPQDLASALVGAYLRVKELSLI